VLIQYGVIPVRWTPDGGVEILLITSRETRRWVVPRGNPMPGRSPAEAGAQEAHEEAGIAGRTHSEPLGRYRYEKRRRDGSSEETEVLLFRMDVEKVADRWPEMSQRERRWFGAEEAALAVQESELADLIRRVGGELSQK